MFPLSASAAVVFLDYNDFITDVTVDADNDIVTVNIPVKYSRITLTGSDGSVYHSFDGKLEAALGAGVDVTYSCSVFGNSRDYPISYENIPSDTVVDFSFSVSYDGFTQGFTTPNISAGYYTLNANGNVIAQRTKSLGAWNYGDLISTSFTIVRDQRASGFVSFVVLNPIQMFVEEPNFSVNLESYTLTMSISSLYRLQEETGKTNELLQLISEKLDQMHDENLNWFERIWKAITDGFNAVLDAIGNIIGISSEDKQAAEDFKNDAIDKSEKLEGAVDAMGSVNKPPADQVQVGMDTFLPSDGGNYVTQTMNVIVANPIVSQQLTIVVVIMFASFVLFGKKEA